MQTCVSAQTEQRYEKSIRPLLQQACFDCHSGESVEGNFRADQLDPDLVGGKDTAWWLKVYSVLSKGKMPPPESSELTAAQRVALVDSNECRLRPRKKCLDKSIESIRMKFEGMRDEQAEQIERPNRKFQAPADRSHYLELSTGQRAEVDWSYRKATYAFRPDNTYKLMPSRSRRVFLMPSED